ncbi:hypothetical protein MRB53_037696 [Persea americana]|nr:hypothetical protein MRB53_037696 [Persea americana]
MQASFINTGPDDILSNRESHIASLRCCPGSAKSTGQVHQRMTIDWLINGSVEESNAYQQDEELPDSEVFGIRWSHCKVQHCSVLIGRSRERGLSVDLISDRRMESLHGRIRLHLFCSCQVVDHLEDSIDHNLLIIRLRLQSAMRISGLAFVCHVHVDSPLWPRV